jgi:hypothetical protein
MLSAAARCRLALFHQTGFVDPGGFGIVISVQVLIVAR